MSCQKGKWRALGASAGLLLAACVSLSKTQLAAVQNFNKAASGYSTLPTGALASYADLHQAVAVLKASTLGADQAALALSKLHHEARFDAEARKNAGKLASAVRIIGTYASGLTTLTNAQDVATLDANATALATSLDGAINAYDSTGGPAIGTSGANIFLGAAAAVSGLILESRRVGYVKEFVRSADPLIQRLAGGSGELVKLLNDLQSHAAIDAQAIDQAYAVHFRPSVSRRDFSSDRARVEVFFHRAKGDDVPAARIADAVATSLLESGAPLDAKATARLIVASAEKVHVAPGEGLDDLARSLAASPVSPRLSVAELEVFQTAITRSSELTTHVDAALTATAAIAKLHAGLKKAMDEGVTLEGLVAEGEAVAAQIQVGVKIGEGPKDGGGPTDTGAAGDAVAPP